MIVFSIAHGEAYIRILFERALRSLSTPGNLPSVAAQNPELCVLTLDPDVVTVQRYLKTPAVTGIFGDRVTILSQDPAAGSAPDGSISGPQNRMHLFIVRAIAHCLERDRAFFHMVPDCIFAEGTVKTCHTLHRLTGKTIAIFDGRVGRADKPFSEQEALAALERPHGVRDFFFANFNPDWQKCYTTDVDDIPGTVQGNLLYDGGDVRYLFSVSPNPVLGKFTEDDLLFFQRGRGFRAWDHEWADRLDTQQRLLIYPNLDHAMTVGPEAKYKFANVAEALAQVKQPGPDLYESAMAELGEDSLEVRRRYKFGNRHGNFCFTTQARRPSA